MEFFDKLSKKASETYKATTEKTGKIAKEAKLRMKINENKSDIAEIYKEIGKKVYEKHIREENISIKDELEEECTKIDVLSAEIETCLNDILALKDRKKCPNCSTELDLSAKFCTSCGAKQEEIVESPEEAKEVEVLTNTEKTSDEAEKVEELETIEVPENKENKKEFVMEELKEEMKEEDKKD